jgi:hypothetical protein
MSLSVLRHQQRSLGTCPSRSASRADLSNEEGRPSMQGRPSAFNPRLTLPRSADRDRGSGIGKSRSGDSAECDRAGGIAGSLPGRCSVPDAHVPRDLPQLEESPGAGETAPVGRTIDGLNETGHHEHDAAPGQRRNGRQSSRHPSKTRLRSGTRTPGTKPRHSADLRELRMGRIARLRDLSDVTMDFSRS